MARVCSAVKTPFSRLSSRSFDPSFSTIQFFRPPLWAKIIHFDSYKRNLSKISRISALQPKFSQNFSSLVPKMFKNFSSLDHRSIFLVYYYRPYFRKKKKKKKKKNSLDPLFSALHWTYPSKTKQNKTKTKPLKGPTFHLTSHSSTPLDFAQCQRGKCSTLGKCSYWEGLAYE